MNRIILAALLVTLVLPTAALAGRDKSDSREKSGDRTETRYKGDKRGSRDQAARPAQPVQRARAVVRAGFPIHRPAPLVVVRRHPVPVERRVYYTHAPIIWAGIAIGRSPHDRWAWEDSEVLKRWEGWTDVVLDVNGSGGSLYFELSGPTQLDFAEVVLNNGQTRVVDFRERTHRGGIYELMDFRHDTRVDYVRVVARAMAPSVRLSVRLAP